MAKAIDTIKSEYLDYLKRDRHEKDKWIEYYDKDIQRVVKTDDDLFITIEKPRINTDFCYGESGYDMDDAIAACRRADTDQDRFRQSNLRDLDQRIEMLMNGNVWIVFGSDTENRVASVHLGDKNCGPGFFYGNQPIREATSEERKRLLTAYEDVRASFKKRIDTYLKRYGLIKVHSWTYWRDA